MGGADWTFSLLDTSPSVGAKHQAEEPPGVSRASSLHSLPLGWDSAPSSPQRQPLLDDPVTMDNSRHGLYLVYCPDAAFIEALRAEKGSGFSPFLLDILLISGSQ